MILFLNSQKSKFNEKDFVQHVKKSYHQFNDNGNNSIQSSVFSQSFINYLQSKTNETNNVSVRVNWSNPKKIKLNITEFSLETSDFIENRNQLIYMSQNFLSVWSDLVVNSPIPDSAMNFDFSIEKNQVFFSYVEPLQDAYARVVKKFAINGVLLEIVIQLPNKQEIITRPKYHSINNKWLCTGWFYQRLNDTSEVLEGMNVKIIYKEVEKNLYPFDVLIEVQVNDNSHSKGLERLFFRNFAYNELAIE